MNFSEKYFYNVMSQQNEDNRRKERYEVCYASLPDEKPNYKFLFWESKNEARYYTEILNNLDKEIKKINYPRIADKVYIILAVSASLYNSHQNPIMWLYLFLSGLAHLYVAYEVVIEAYSMAIGNRSVLDVSIYQDYLKPLVSKKLYSFAQRSKFQKLKQRVVSLDTSHCIWNIALILLDMLFSIVIIVLSIHIFCLRVNIGIKTFNHDVFCYIASKIFSIGFSIFYLTTCIVNWIWFCKSKRLAG